MPIMVERDKWILYKHTCNYELIKAVALDVKNSCASDISEIERYRMQERLAALDLYHTRNPKNKPLDSINHRINTLEFFMFGYEDNRRFIFSPLGNLFLKHINNEENLRKIFTAMLFAIQFEHPANGTQPCFQLFPFRLLFKLMLEERLDYKLYSTEYAYCVAFIKKITPEKYDELIENILSFRKLDDETKMRLLKEDEHTYVNCIYEWQYYMQKLLSSVGVISLKEGYGLGKLFHPSKTNSNSNPTGRMVKTDFATIAECLIPFVEKMLNEYSVYDMPLRLDDCGRMRFDVIKEIYSFYPNVLLEEIGENKEELRLLELPRL
ncbi:MAG: AlwI family type II restriction endonuclease, partial [Oscillospiraceae bacterium]|nr:AlwI family type II restriction endonuclease [Oscillospiraceae bacterium]